MYKAEREVKKLRAKHAACTIVIRNAGETIRDLAKSCGVAATTICALNHYRRHLVRGVRARSARISLFSFTSSEDSLVSLTQPIILTLVVSLTRNRSTRILRKYSTHASRSNTGTGTSRGCHESTRSETRHSSVQRI